LNENVHKLTIRGISEVDNSVIFIELGCSEMIFASLPILPWKKVTIPLKYHMY